MRMTRLSANGRTQTNLVVSRRGNDKDACAVNKMYLRYRKEKGRARMRNK
jgi:hypothetical protein